MAQRMKQEGPVVYKQFRVPEWIARALKARAVATGCSENKIICAILARAFKRK